MSEASTSVLLEQIDADLKQAMRDRNEVAKLTLRSVEDGVDRARTSGAEHALGEPRSAGLNAAKRSQAPPRCGGV